MEVSVSKVTEKVVRVTEKATKPGDMLTENRLKLLRFIIEDSYISKPDLESWGTGVSRMVEACKAVGLSEPEYGTDGTFV